MKIDDYLPLSYLNAWEYCARRFYLEYVLGEMVDNEHMLLGRHIHRQVDEGRIFQEGDTLVRQQQWVWSDRLQIKGIIDVVEERAGALVPVEFKKGRMAQHLNDHFQLCAAALCLEEQMGCTIDHGEIFYHGNRRRQRVAFTPELRRMTEGAISLAHQAAYGAMPEPISQRKKCRACSLEPICLPREVRRLRVCSPD
jgi:CRISPR-associated exonuclease Cas4